MLSVCDSVQGTLSSVWQIPFAAPAGGWYGGGGMTILSLWFREAVAYQQTIQHPNMPSTEFPFGIYIQGKELKYKKRLFSPFAKGKKKKKRKLTSTFRKLAYRRTRTGHLCAAGPTGAGCGGEEAPHPADTPPGAGPHGKGGRRGWGVGAPVREPWSSPDPSIPCPRARPARAPPARGPRWIIPPQINKQIQPRPAPGEASVAHT